MPQGPWTCKSVPDYSEKNVYVKFRVAHSLKSCMPNISESGLPKYYNVMKCDNAAVIDYLVWIF